MKNVIFAVAEDNSFGNKDGTLPWGKPIKEDMEFFMEVTKETGAVVMGATTFRSLPKKLKGRKNIVIARNNSDYRKLKTKSGDKPDLVLPYQGVIFSFIDSRLESEGITNYSVIGGAKLIDSAILSGRMDCIYKTEVKGSFDSDIKLDLSEYKILWDQLKESENIAVFEGSKVC